MASVICKNNITTLISALSSIAIFFVLEALDIDTLFPLDSISMALPFYCIGIVGRVFLMLNVKWYLSILQFIIVSGLCLYLSTINGRCDLDTCIYGNSYITFILTGTSMSFSIIILSKQLLLFQHGWLTKITRTITNGASLIVGTNILFLFYARLALAIVIPDSEWTDLSGLILGLILLICYIPLIKITKLYFPIALGR